MNCFRRFSSSPTIATTPSSPIIIAGTVQSHRCYIFLHTAQSPREFPARISTAVQRALMLKVIRWGGIVNFAWSPNLSTLGAEPEKYSATAFSTPGGRLDIPELSLENVDEVEQLLREHVERPPELSDTDYQGVDLYVCTHGARDCRCGDLGGQVVKALQEELLERTSKNPNGAAARVRVWEAGHVGGHQYAANLIVFPHGEWLGLLKPDDIPRVLDAILEQHPRPFTRNDAPLITSHWRGRTGLNKEEQMQLYASHQKNDSQTIEYPGRLMPSPRR